MELQPLILDFGQKPKELFIRGGHCDRGVVTLAPGESLTTDTLFNGLYLKSWIRYTRANSFSLMLRLTGQGRVIVYSRSSNDSESPTELRARDFSYDEIHTVSIPIDIECREAEYCYFQIDSLKTTKLYDGAYTSAVECHREIRFAGCICTYKRERALADTVERLKSGILENPASILHDCFELFIADNGGTIDGGAFQEDSRIHVYANRNLGGSAGFTRCMIESVFGQVEEPFSHLVLMDDDAFIEPWGLERLARFLSVIKPGYALAQAGGALIDSDSPFIQQEHGAFFDGFVHPRGAHRDMRKTTNVIDNLSLGEINYNGWWLTAIPTALVTEDNLPLPLFIHGDDIDYGMRGNVFVVDGVCAWHEMDYVRRRPYLSFYDARNGAIVMVHHEPSLRSMRLAKTMLKRVLRLLLVYRYESAEYALAGYEAFLGGADDFLRTDAEALHRELLQRYQIHYEPLQGMPDVRTQQTCKSSVARILQKLINYLIPGIRGTNVVSSSVHDKDVDYLGFRSIAFVYEQEGVVCVFHKSLRRALVILAKLMRLLLRGVVSFKDCREQWDEMFPILQSLSFWKTYLGLRDED